MKKVFDENHLKCKFIFMLAFITGKTFIKEKEVRVFNLRPESFRHKILMRYKIKANVLVL